MDLYRISLECGAEPSGFCLKRGENMVKINGEFLEEEGKTLTEYLESAGYQIQRVAVEKNGEIVPKAEYSGTVLENGDSIEVVSFVGGG